jgi:hypothetical protein
MSTSRSGTASLELVLVRQFNNITDPGPRLNLVWDGEATVGQYTLLCDPINLIGIIMLDMIRANGITRNSGAGIVFMVDSSKILYMRECKDIDEINVTYEQAVTGEFSNNQLGFPLTLGSLVKYTEKLWAKRLGYTHS